MPPQETTPEPQPAPAMQPSTPPTPTPTIPEQTTPVPAAQPQPQAAPNAIPTTDIPRKHTLRLVLAIIGGIVIILIVLFVLSAGALQATSTSNKFMNDITTGNVPAAAALTDGDSDNTAFLQQAAKNVFGSWKIKTTKVQNSQDYILYTLTNSTNKYARTTMKKESGGWKVTSFVYSPTALSIIPSSTAQ